MQIKRTANAGVLLELDGVTILMDGVCREIKPYPATPPEIRAQLTENMPDVVAFTHVHKDHYDPGFAAQVLQKNGVILGPVDCRGTMESMAINNVRITPIPSRHIGAAGKTVAHTSFIIEGSCCIWFTGDASPSQWQHADLPKPDVLIVPYAYCNTPSAWAATQSLGASVVVLVHMPAPEDDSIGLWSAVEHTVEGASSFYIPLLNEQLTLQL